MLLNGVLPSHQDDHKVFGRSLCRAIQPEWLRREKSTRELLSRCLARHAFCVPETYILTMTVAQVSDSVTLKARALVSESPFLPVSPLDQFILPRNHKKLFNWPFETNATRLSSSAKPS